LWRRSGIATAIRSSTRERTGATPARQDKGEDAAVLAKLVAAMEARLGSVVADVVAELAKLPGYRAVDQLELEGAAAEHDANLSCAGLTGPVVCAAVRVLAATEP
jgi:hypothetical protein